jgi:hypothetical protein
MVMTGSKRLAMTFAVVATSGALATGCTAAGGTHPAAATERAVPTASFSAMGLSFEYPATWRSGTWSRDVSSFTALIVYLSTSRMRDPCSVSTNPGRILVSCGYPVGKLPPWGILVRWDADGFPTWQMPKANTTAGGRAAVETRTTGGWCATLGGTETITVMIQRAAAN